MVLMLSVGCQASLQHGVKGQQSVVLLVAQ